MRPRGGIVVAALMVAVALTSCSSSKTTAIVPAPSTTGPPAPAPASAAAQALGARLITVVPAGFMLQPDQVGDTGPSDLAKAVRDDGTPGAEQALRSEGFVEGYLRQWVGPARADITVFVYQFATAAGSQADFQRGTVNLANQSPPGATPFTVDGLPTAQSNGLIGSSPNLSAAVVTFTSGVFLAEVVCDGPALAGLQDCASAIAKDQFSRL